MKLRALSKYNNDTNTRFGDCILVYDKQNLIVYDCGCDRHSDEVMSFLGRNPSITNVSVITSHNDRDHTDGICRLLEQLYLNYNVILYTPLYLKSVGPVMKQLDDGRRTSTKTKEHILETFDHIKEIVEKAQELEIPVQNTAVGTIIGTCTIVGPTEKEFSGVVATAIDNAVGDNIDGETVMNAASVQLRCPIDGMGDLLLCGDATPEYLHNIWEYDIIQLPHHGKLDSAKKIFDVLENDGDGIERYEFLISDNTGSAQNSGGSDDLVEYMKKQWCLFVYNTKDHVVILPSSSPFGSSIHREGSSFVLGY